MKENKKVDRRALIFLVLFLVLWLVGLAAGEPLRVLEQAKSICLECIGIG